MHDQLPQWLLCIICMLYGVINHLIMLGYTGWGNCPQSTSVSCWSCYHQHVGWNIQHRTALQLLTPEQTALVSSNFIQAACKVFFIATAKFCLQPPCGFSSSHWFLFGISLCLYGPKTLLTHSIDLQKGINAMWVTTQPRIFLSFFAVFANNFLWFCFFFVLYWDSLNPWNVRTSGRSW